MVKAATKKRRAGFYTCNYWRKRGGLAPLSVEEWERRRACGEGVYDGTKNKDAEAAARAEAAEATARCASDARVEAMRAELTERPVLAPIQPDRSKPFDTCELCGEVFIAVEGRKACSACEVRKRKVWRAGKEERSTA